MSTTSDRFEIVVSDTLHYFELTSHVYPSCKCFVESPIPIRFDVKGKTAGRVKTRAGNFSIHYNPEPIYNGHFSEFLSQTVPHEVAHVVSKYVFGFNIKSHGKEWKYIMERVFQTPAYRTCEFNLSPAKKTQNFRYSCSCNYHYIGAKRHRNISNGLRNYYCQDCKENIVYDP